MFRYIMKRILMMIPVLIAVSFVVYFLMDLAPGDIISSMAPQDATEAEIEIMREELGLNGSLIERYFRYLGNLLRGDMGMSLSLKRPVADVFFERFPATLELALAATVVALAISIPLGIAAATHHRSFLDGFSMVTAMLGLSMPGLLAGSAADPVLLPSAGLAPLRRQRRHCSSDPACPCVGRRSGRQPDPYHPLLHAGRDPAGLPSHRPRQGRQRKNGHPQARAEKRTDPHYHGVRLYAGQSAGRRRGD